MTTLDTFLGRNKPALSGEQAPALTTATLSPPQDVVSITDTTPSGIEVLYQASPKRLYKVRKEGWESPERGWQEVPSVTTVLDVLQSHSLVGWAQKIGVRGVLELFKKERLAEVFDWHANNQKVVVLGENEVDATEETVLAAMKDAGLDKDSVRDQASARGDNVHKALEKWAESGGEFAPTPQDFPEHERKFVTGFLNWVDDLGGRAVPIAHEVMVGSVKHGFAGRFDLLLQVNEPVGVVKTRSPLTRQELPPGRYLCDLKTGKSIYDKVALQLAGYELAAVEGGYEPTDHRAVLHISPAGNYKFVLTKAQPSEFLAVLECWKTMEQSKKWFA